MAGGNDSQELPGQGRGFGAGRFMQGSPGQGQPSGLMPWDYQVPRPPMPAAPAMSGASPAPPSNRGGGANLSALMPLLAMLGPLADPKLMMRGNGGRGISDAFGGRDFGGGFGGFGGGMGSEPGERS